MHRTGHEITPPFIEVPEVKEDHDPHSHSTPGHPRSVCFRASVLVAVFLTVLQLLRQGYDWHSLHWVREDTCFLSSIDNAGSRGRVQTPFCSW